jgi:predicted nucleotidyltransferase
MVDNYKIEIVVQKLVVTYQPQRIYLFGSYAWGYPNNESDLDLMVIVKESSEKPYQRLKPAYRALRGLKIPKDILVYTEGEFERQASEPSSLFHKIKTEGVKLFEIA